MNLIEIDGKLIKKEGHDYIKEALNFPDYYGKNLDALYDCLTEIGIETQIKLINADLISNDLLETFIDASDENAFLEFDY
ncbi:barstar family protein [Methanobrevibacter sp.]|uniref:barstar family protein n=1 Tax=Methanobrevibacter sp. TaxID=66852 RepID=UPI0038903147